VLIAIFRGGDDEPAETATTVPTETAPAQTQTGAQEQPSFQISESGTLSEGDSGRSVRRLQRALAQLGYAVTPDGEYGPGTTTAVQAFQEDAGLEADGVAGPETARAINSALTGGG
jgi:peptidoglycan hydrolase-like protein with peptidoglycan-binding domain